MNLSKTLGFSSLLAEILLASTAFAQTRPAPSVPVPYGIGDAVRQSDQSRQPPIKAPAPNPVLPEAVEPGLTLKDKETLRVLQFQIEGGLPENLTATRQILRPYENRSLTLTQIYEAAAKVTSLYRDQGYLVAKAYVPAQDARNGILRLKIVLGQLGSVTIQNKSYVNDDRLKRVAERALQNPPIIARDKLERAMLLIADLPGASLPRIAVSPGQRQGTSDLVFSVPPDERVEGFLTYDNGGSRFTGRDRFNGGVNVNSPLGYGDRLSLSGVATDSSGLLNGRVAYSLPIGYSGLRAEIGGYKTTYVLGSAYSDLDATGNALAFYAELSYPIIRTRDQSVTISATFTHNKLNDKIFGTSIARRTIDLGSVELSRDANGRLFGLPLSTSTSLSFTSGYVDFSDPVQRLQNIISIDTEGHYDRLNLSATANLGLLDKLALSIQLRAQKALTGSLDSSEQLTMSGFYGIRSFDEGVSADEGYIFTPELKYTLPAISRISHSVGLFTDIAGGWINNAAFITTQNSFTQLNDVGAGYYVNYEYMAGRYIVGKAMIAHTYGSNSGAGSYDRGTKGIFQVGITF